MSQEKKTNSENCTHRKPRELRLITYTRYGAMVGCLQCGTSWLIRDERCPEKQRKLDTALELVELADEAEVIRVATPGGRGRAL